MHCPCALRVTNEDGRCSNLLPPGPMPRGTYRLHFDTRTYYASLNESKPFFPFVEVYKSGFNTNNAVWLFLCSFFLLIYPKIVFCLDEPQEHYHVPLLLSPYSYSTYRGS